MQGDTSIALDGLLIAADGGARAVPLSLDMRPGRPPRRTIPTVTEVPSVHRAAGRCRSPFAWYERYVMHGRD